MFETVITMVGTVAGEITRRRTGDDIPVVSFRLQTKERRYNRDLAQWVDGDKMFVSVRCWRELGENVGKSLARGDRVIVVGRLQLREHESDNHRRLSAEIDARSVGPDLLWNTVEIYRTAFEPQPLPIDDDLPAAA